MAPPYLPLDVLLMIAYEMTNDDGARCFDDLNAFLQVNRTLHHHLNPLLWREAASSSKTTECVLTHLLNTRNLGRLKYFLELGCNLETILPDLDTDGDVPVDYLGPSALVAAINMDSVPMARLLLENGATVVYPAGIPCFSAMHAARSAEMVQLLLEFGADVRVAHEELGIPLHSAAASGRTEVVKVLLECWPEGAKVRDGVSFTPLHLAAFSGRTEVVKVLLDCWPEGVRAMAWGAPLHCAVFKGQTDVVKLLLEFWPEGLRQKTDLGDTVFHVAARKGQLDVVKLLVECWPEGKEATNSAGLTPLAMLMVRDKLRTSLDVAQEKELVTLLSC
jgi:ankyrin repeat protein